MAEDCLDHKLCEEMAEYVEKITLSGEPTLHVETMKKFKKICRISDLYVKHAYHMLMSTLEKDHAEIRLSTFKMMDELFNRSHSFRELLVSNFQRFLELTVETDHDQPLPPPLFAAKKLRAETLKSLQQWYEKFGDAYKKLVLGYNFLQSCKLVDFNDIRTRTIAERMREEEKERKRKRILDQKLSKVLEETAECVPEIDTCKIEIENCLNLLLPRPEDFFISESDSFFERSDFKHISEQQIHNYNNQFQTQLEGCQSENIPIKGNSVPLDGNISQTCDAKSTDTKDSMIMEENSDSEIEGEDFVNDFGLGSRKYNLNIEICPKKFLIEENEDNKDVFKTLRDSIKVMKEKFSPKILRWLEIMTKAGAKQEQIKEIIDLKSAVDEILTKCVEMKVTEDCDVDMESDEDDFEDVPEKEGYEAEVPLHLLTAAEMGLKEEVRTKRRGRQSKITNQNWSIKSESASLNDPTTRAANLSKLGLVDMNGASTSTSGNHHTSDLKTAGGSNEISAPVVPFGPDLAHWENPEKLEKPMTIKYDSLHRFWTPAEHESELLTQHDVEALTRRTFHYAGTFIPVQWKCRAPLPTGALCERMDRVKCPFHGKIIGRDKTGKPSNIEDAKKLLAEQAKKFKDAVPDWQDLELQRDIEHSLGIDLGSKSAATKGKGKGKGKSKNKKYENLTDIKEIKNTSRSRLEKRIFNKSAMKRVTSRLDAADFKRVRDKFANQFNYAHSK